MQRFHDYMHCSRTSFLRPLIVIFFVAYSIQCEIALAQSELRTWYSATGSFSIEAELLDVRAGKVQLKKKDGSTIWVDLKNLSLGDIRYVNQTLSAAQQSLPEKTSEQPSPSMNDKDPPTESSITAEETEAVDNADSKLPGWETEADYKIGKNPFAGMREGGMSFDSTALSMFRMSDVSSPFFSVRTFAGVGMQVRVGNLRTGKYTDAFSLEGSPSEVKVNPEGTMLACIDGYPQSVFVYNTSTGKKIAEFKPEEMQNVSDLFFLSGQQIALFGSSSKTSLAVHDAKTGKKIKGCEIQQGYTTNDVAMHPSGNMFAVKAGHGEVHIFDIKRGKIVGEINVTQKEDEKSKLSVSDVSFCRSGTELAVVSSSSPTEFHVYSVRTGKPVVKHVLAERSSQINSNRHSYQGEPVEAFEDKSKGWLLYGVAVIDREAGGPVWIDKRDGKHTDIVFRALIDDQKMVSLPRDFSGSKVSVVTIPWSDIAKSKSIVAKGGRAEDSELPQLTIVNRKAVGLTDDVVGARMYQGKVINPVIPPAAATIDLPNGTSYISTICWSGREAALAVGQSTNFQTNQLIATVLHTDDRMFLNSAAIPGGKAIQDVSDDGKWVVFKSGKDGDRFDVYSLPDLKHVVGFRPYPDSELSWLSQSALFVGKDLLLTTEGSQDAVAWEIPSMKPRYRFSSCAQPARFPSGDKFVCLASTGWQVRNGETGEFLGNIESGKLDFASPGTSMQFNADESACACLTGDGHEHRLVVWDLLSGKVRTQVSLPSMSNSSWVVLLEKDNRVTYIDPSTRRQVDNVPLRTVSNLVWCSKDEILLVWKNDDDERFAKPDQISNSVVSLLNVTERRILWDFRVPDGSLMPINPHGQIWYMGHDMNAKMLTGLNLPTELALGHIRKAPRPKQILPVGSSVHLDVVVNVTGESLGDGLLETQLTEVLKSNLQASGVKVSDQAGLKLTLLVSNAVEKPVYQKVYERKLMMVAAISNISEEVLWKRDGFFGEAADEGDGPILAEDVRKKQWEEALIWLRDTVNPKSIFENWYYRGIGESLVAATGEKLIELRVETKP